MKSTLYKIKDNTITFLKGRHSVSTSIIIPEGMKVVFEPGTELIFNNNTFFNTNNNNNNNRNNIKTFIHQIPPPFNHYTRRLNK